MNRNLTATLLIIIGLGIYFTITRSMVADAQAVKTKNNELASALNNADEIIKSRNDVTKKYASIPERDRIKLDKMIPSAVDNIRLAIDLNNLALQNHFALSNVKASVPSNSSSAQAFGSQAGRAQGSLPPPPAPGPGGNLAMSQYVADPILDTVTVSFNATAAYQEFIDFLEDIEMNLRIMDLTHLSVKANDTGSYDFNVEFQTYWLRQ